MKVIEKKAKVSASRAIEAVARRHGVSVEAVRKEIGNALEMAQGCQDPRAKAFWKWIPKEGKEPTPEEVIAYIVLTGRGTCVK